MSSEERLKYDSLMRRYVQLKDTHGKTLAHPLGSFVRSFLYRSQINKGKKIVIFGATNCGNVGDDLIGVILKRQLERYAGGAEVVLTQQHKREAMLDADAVVIGGGGLIYDYDMENVDNYVDIILRANHLGIPVYMLGMGIQHVFTEEAMRKYQNALSYVQHIETRADDDTDFIVNHLKYSREKIITGRDVVFLCDEPLDNTIRSTKPTILLALADWKLGGANNEKVESGLTDAYTQYQKYLFRRVSELKGMYDFIIVQQATEDIELSKKLVNLTGGELVAFDTIEDSLKLVNIYRRADLAITGRYHGLIAGLLANTPTIGVSFSGHKQEKLIKDTFPSLLGQLYTVKTFVQNDVFSIIERDIASFSTAKPKELRRAKKLSRLLRRSIGYLRDDLSRL